MKDISILEIISVEELKKILNSFILATGLGAIFISADKELVIVPDDHDSVCEFCKIIRSCPEGERRCNQSIYEAGRLACQFGEPYITRCHAGLVEFSAPIMHDDVFLGSISCGPVLMWNWDEIAVKEILEKTKDLPIDPTALITASHKIRVLSSRNVQASANLLFILTNHIAKSGMTALAQRKKINEQQSKLSEIIYQQKMMEESLHDAEKNVYPLEKENHLVTCVKTGNRNKANEILNELLGSILFHSAGNEEIIKSRILELVVVISRAAVEGGASLQKLLGMNYEFISQLADLNKIEDVCEWIIKVLDRFMDTVYNTKHTKNAKIIGNTMKFIIENFNRSLTLDEVAQNVFISPYYLSHLFKEEMGFTFMEYLTKVRIEEAKRLLKDTPLPIITIASNVGYEDPSYFSKVFKKTTGLSPNTFRKNS